MKKSNAAALICSFVIMAGIFYFSSRPGDVSMEQSDVFLFLVPWLSDDRASHLIRKTAHFSIYACLGFSLFFAFRHESLKTTAALAIACAFLYASSDEFHQFFVPGRSAMFADVLLDTAGAAFGTAAAVLCLQIMKKRR